MIRNLAIIFLGNLKRRSVYVCPKSFQISAVSPEKSRHKTEEQIQKVTFTNIQQKSMKIQFTVRTGKSLEKTQICCKVLLLRSK